MKIFKTENLRDRYVGASKWQVFKFRVRRFFIRLFQLALVLVLFFIAFQILRYYFPVYKDKEIFVEKEVSAPVLERIAKCESSGKHMSNGQVVMSGNSNGSVDVGLFQINVRIWGKVAGDLGYNLTIEEDNKAFAVYLYNNYGTEPWIWSKACWNK